MKTPLAFGSALLVSTFLGTTGLAQVGGGTPAAPSTPAQTVPAPSTPVTPTPEAAEQPGTTSEPGPDSAEAPQEEVDVSIPGGADAEAVEEFVVVGRNIPEPVRATSQVINVLSTEDIARTGEGDIAGALQRVTGLSVVGQGFVYVRGLGDRYSLSLLNGSPLPSPEPLRRVVPLDIFPSRIVASALVQKTFSPNYPGEFGGGVINLTTVAVPNENFFDAGVSISGDTETTAKLGYTYYGGDLDFLGYDDGTRSTPGFIRAAGANNTSVSALTDVARLSNASTTVLQRNGDIPANFSAETSFGAVSDIGAARLGAVASAGYSSSWQTRDALQQATRGITGQVDDQYRVVQTDNRVLVNGIIGLGLDIDEHRFRLTSLYIHDTVKEGRLASGYNIDFTPTAGAPDPLIEQNTLFFERQLYDLQGVAELDFGDLNVDLRGTFARTNRDSPYERSFGYVYSPAIRDYTNQLGDSITNGASIAFSELEEEVLAGGVDVGYELPTTRPILATVGYAYTDTDRTSTRYTFFYRRRDGSGLDPVTAQLRPDFLLSDLQLIGNPTNPNDDIILVNRSGDQGAARYDAGLRIHAGYGQLEVELADGIRATGGVRFEQSDQSIVAASFNRVLESDYWLPALTLTWNFANDMQVRLHGSKTIARPQFRELAPQAYLDFTSDRLFRGNPFLENSELYNFEARYEWFFDRDQRVTLAGFYKRIDNPIEAIAFYEGSGSTLTTGFSNAPRADLYGGEIELQKYVPLDTLGDAFATKRLVLIGNYTYTQSELQIDDGDVAISPVLGAGLQPQLFPANQLFQPGAPLTGQSDHLVNVQIGFEDTERLSQATLLFTYASERVTNRGPVSDGARLPDLVERPGIRLDFVAREAVTLLGAEVNLKFEARNLTGTRYDESQQFEDTRVFINRYDLGTSFSLGASLSF